jgi:hypothetical protein
VGGGATSDNVGPVNLITIARGADGRRELSDRRGDSPAPSAPAEEARGGDGRAASLLSREDIEAITRAVLARLS